MSSRPSVSSFIETKNLFFYCIRKKSDNDFPIAYKYAVKLDLL